MIARTALALALLAGTALAAEPAATLQVTVDKDGTIRLNGEVMPNAAAVAARLQALQAGAVGKPAPALAVVPAATTVAEAGPPGPPPSPAPAVQPPSSIQWSDTYVSYRSLWQDRQPGYPGNIQEHAVNISYANGWDLGSNFVSLDLENFTHQDGSNTVGPHVSAGSAEFYGVFRTTFSGNKVFHTKDFSAGPIADVGLELGLDLDTQNDQFASFKKLVVFGPQFAIAMPKGFWTVSVHAAHEWNTDAYLPNGNGTNYDWVPEFETAWLYPVDIGPVPAAFTGYANVILPKGKGATGDFDHRTEVLAHPKLLVDVGSLVGYESGKIDAGVGYEYWLNKFGSYNAYVGGGTQQNAWFGELGYHFH